jgi:hypothetical protein
MTEAVAQHQRCDDVIESRVELGKHGQRLIALEDRADKTDNAVSDLAKAMRELTEAIVAGQRQIFLAVIGILASAALAFLGYLIVHALGGK